MAMIARFGCVLTDSRLKEPGPPVRQVRKAMSILLSFVPFPVLSPYSGVKGTPVPQVRKALSILLSFVLFPKPFAPIYATALLLFATGLALEAAAGR